MGERVRIREKGAGGRLWNSEKCRIRIMVRSRLRSRLRRRVRNWVGKKGDAGKRFEEGTTFFFEVGYGIHL